MTLNRMSLSKMNLSKMRLNLDGRELDGPLEVKRVDVHIVHRRSTNVGRECV